MRQLIQKGTWAAARVVFQFFAAVGMGSGGLVTYLLGGPLCSWYLFNDARFLKYQRLIFPIARAYWRLGLQLTFNAEYRRIFGTPWTAAPMMDPDLSRIRLRASWSGAKEGCNGCTQCCTLRGCPILDAGSGRCLSYGSFFWRYFNCGRYPENEDQIRYYDCPKWEVRGGDPCTRSI